jgi:anti-sigma B factor antagonist
VKKSNTISVGKFDDICWIRCQAKGSFLNSPVVKQWAEAQLVAGSKTFVMDLQDCTGMDSTFMGNLVDLAMKATSAGGGLQVAEGPQKCVDLLDGLGLSSLMEINPENARWEENKVSIRERLVVVESSGGDKAQHVYETHKKLCEADSNNEEKFSSVLDCLEAELFNKKA